MGWLGMASVARAVEKGTLGVHRPFKLQHLPNVQSGSPTFQSASGIFAVTDGFVDCDSGGSLSQDFGSSQLQECA